MISHWSMERVSHTYGSVYSSWRKLLRFEPMRKLFNNKSCILLPVPRVIPFKIDEIIRLTVVSLVLFWHFRRLMKTGKIRLPQMTVYGAVSKESNDELADERDESCSLSLRFLLARKPLAYLQLQKSVCHLIVSEDHILAEIGRIDSWTTGRPLGLIGSIAMSKKWRKLLKFSNFSNSLLTQGN